MNPYLPPWEYIPDGEPHIFDGRVYVYGSHDRAHGYVFCQLDYVCWSASVTDLTDWRYEGVIYKKTSDPLNHSGQMVMWASDAVKGADGRYYLYYVFDKAPVVSVAVCDTPAGEYKFYGYVHYKDGENLGEKDGDEPQFDPAVFSDNGKIYLYAGGQGVVGDDGRNGAIAVVLSADMLTIEEPPVYIVPSKINGKGTSFEGHEFFEASSMRKIGDIYYFIYSSVHMSELCYATSKHPTKDFTYGGVIIHNGYGNNHGSIIEIENQWYVFYHRLTNGTWFSRQGCIEPIEIKSDGTIPQVEMTSQGARREPFPGKGTYPAVCACYLTSEKAKITQDGIEDNADCFITDITDKTTIGFKYFNCEAIKKITLTTRAYGSGNFEIRTDLNGECLGVVPVVGANVWTDFSAAIAIPKGVRALYFTYKGGGTPHLLSFGLS